MKNVYIVEYQIVDNMNRVRRSSIVGVFDQVESFTETMKKNIARKHPDHTVTFSMQKSTHLFY